MKKIDQCCSKTITGSFGNIRESLFLCVRVHDCGWYTWCTPYVEQILF